MRSPFLKTLLRKPAATVMEGQTLRQALHKMVHEDVNTLAVIGRDGRTVGALNHQSLRFQDLDTKLTRKHLSLQQIVYLNPQATSPPDEHAMGWSKQPVPVACKASGEFLGLLFHSDFAKAAKGEPLRLHQCDDCGFAPIHDG